MFLFGDFCFCRSFAETCTRIHSALQSKVFSGISDLSLFIVLFDVSFWFLLMILLQLFFRVVVVGVLLYGQFAKERE